MLRINKHLTERVILAFEHLQFVGLLWSSQSAWPSSFRHASRFVAWFNLDVMSFYSLRYGGQMPTAFFNVSVIWWFLLFWGLVALLFAVVCQLYISYGRLKMIRGISRHEYYAVVTGRLLVVPYFLSLSRIFPCNINSGTLLFDPTLECGSVPHLIRAAVSLLISMLFFLTYFFYVIDRVKDAVVHRDQERHDKYLRSRQLEYALGITDVYETSGLALCGQFRLVHVAFTPYFDMFKAVFAMQWVILEGNGNARAITSVFLTVAMCVWFFFAHPYRSRVTNVLFFVLYTTLLALEVITWGRIGAPNTTSLTVDTTIHLLLTVTCIAGFVLAVLIPSFVAQCIARQNSKCADSLGTGMTIYRLIFGSPVGNDISLARLMWRDGVHVERRLHGTCDTRGIEWRPTGKHWRHCRVCFLWCCSCRGGELKPFVIEPNVQGWINAVKEAQVLLRDNSIIPKELVRVDLLKKFASILRTAWLEASSRSSFGANGGHLLALTLYEHLQQIIAMRQVNKLHSFYPRQDLGHDNMAHMAQMANISKRKFILVDPRLKGVVRKLVAVRAWFTIGIGKTSIPPILVNNEERESSFK